MPHNESKRLNQVKEIKIKSWHEFQSQIHNLYDKLFLTKPLGFSKLLFRGQPDLGLRTTLDRYFDNPISLIEYYDMIMIAQPQIETFTGHTWATPSSFEYKQRLNNLEFPSLNRLLSEPDIYSYMAYMRHHGFPSPLLDWTNSPYVASFFAFDDKGDRDSVVVYAYLEYAGSGKSISYDKPWISTLGPNVKTHKRHFLQQSNYSVCIQRKNNTAYYASHEEVFSSDDDDQDLRWKFIIPATEKMSFLKELDLMNINAYSLFPSEESLMKTLALRYNLRRS